MCCNQTVDTSRHAWGNYLLAAWKGAHDRLAAAGVPRSALPGARLVVDGTVPPGAGLSSSSALVVASLLAFLTASGQVADGWAETPAASAASAPLSAAAVAELACACERYVGTMGGGMDQAVSLLAREGAAKHVTFNPVSGGGGLCVRRDGLVCVRVKGGRLTERNWPGQRRPPYVLMMARAQAPPRHTI